jgi:hypothetical protein
MVVKIMDGNSSTHNDFDGTGGITEPIRTRPGNVSTDADWKSSGADTGGEGIVEQAQQKVGEVAGQVQEKAGAVVDQVRERATTTLDRQKDQAAGSLWGVANAIRQTGEALRDKDQAAFAQVTDKAADQIERISSFLGHRDVNQIVNEVQHFARRQPALFLGGAFALGLIGARFLKSSSQSSQSSSESDYSGQAYRVAGNGSGSYGYGYGSGGYGSYGSEQSGMAAGTLLGDYSGDGESRSGADSGDWLGSSYGGTTGSAGGYSASGSITAPPIRGVDPRVSGGTGSSSYSGETDPIGTLDDQQDTGA